MSKRRPEALSIHLGLAILVCLLGASCGSAEDPKPALSATLEQTAETAVLVVVDSLRRDHLMPYGYPLETSPHLARLAQDSLVFEDCVAVTTGANAGLASLLTGMNSQDHGVASLRHRGQQRLPASCSTLAEALHQEGWHTLAAVSLPQLRADISGLSQGFEVYLEPALHEGRMRTAQQTYFGALPALRQAMESGEPVFVMLHLADPSAP